MRAELESLFEAHRGNLRECLRALYDRWAGPDAPRSALPRDRWQAVPALRLSVLRVGQAPPAISRARRAE